MFGRQSAYVKKKNLYKRLCLFFKKRSHIKNNYPFYIESLKFCMFLNAASHGRDFAPIFFKISQARNLLFNRLYR